ncbi:MAG: hypothetical protein SFW62_05935 [Alphaproteobacteria bacterium]|nr:hypothetical protein [Alphaproteobacteria bacterium]
MPGNPADALHKLAFPYVDGLPAKPSQAPVISLIPFLIGLYFVPPVLGIAFGCAAINACVAMPETAIYKNSHFVFGKDKIWLSRQVFSVTEMLDFHVPELFAKALLGSCIFGPDVSHNFRTFFL